MNCKKLLGSFLISIGFLTLVHAQNAPLTGHTEPIVRMETSLGTIRIKLYNETPKHRDNFLKLAESGYYDSLLFHRVIKNFMIQGGDPDSKHAPYGTMLGEGGPGYTIPAEFNPQLFHKKGALAAAREGDMENPTQASSGSQFYIVQGRVFTDSLLKVQAERITKMRLFNNILNRKENAPLLEKYSKFVQANMPDSVKTVSDIINEKMDAEFLSAPRYTFSEEQRKAYTTIGGAPHLDGSYTVFGEVIEGLEIVDKIAAQATGQAARPVEDIRILKVTVEKPH